MINFRVKLCPMKIPFIVLIVLLPCFGIAQKNSQTVPGYIMKGEERIDGEIRSVARKQVHVKCRFRANGSGSFTDYKPGEIEQFFIEGEGFFKSRLRVLIDNKTYEDLFLRELVPGKATLFEYAGADKSPKYFVEKDGKLTQLILVATISRNSDGSLVKFKDEVYKRTFYEVFSDCPQNTAKISFTRSALSAAVADYNSCIDPSLKSETYRPRPIGFLGLSYGVTFNTLHVEKLGKMLFATDEGTVGVDFSASKQKTFFKTYSGGVTFDVGFMTNKHFTFTTGAIIAKGIIDHNTFEIRYSNLDLPFILKYTALLKHRVRPFVGAGVIVPIQLSTKTKLIPFTGYRYFDWSGEPLSEPVTYPYALQRKDEFDSSIPKFTATLGIEFIISDRIKLSTYYRAESQEISEAYEMKLQQRSVFGSVAYRIN
jgi:hypothetical protein